MKTTHCRSCGAEIIWARTDKQKKMPLDAKPTGQVIVLNHQGGDPPLAYFAPTYVSHFATCPDGASWRKAGV